MEKVTHIINKIRAAREEIKTLQSSGIRSAEEDGVIPRSIFHGCKRQYVLNLIHQINGTYANGWYDATGAMMRRLLETMLIDLFEKEGMRNKIKHNNEYKTIENIIEIAKAELDLPRDVKKALRKVKRLGDRAVHGPRSSLTRHDIDDLKAIYRKTIQEYINKMLY